MKAMLAAFSVAVVFSSLAGPIHNAVVSGNVAEAKKLIAANPSVVNERNENQITPLHAAASLGNIEMAQFLIANHAEVCAKTFQGITPLHNAAGRGNLDMVKLLINADSACINATNSAGMTPLFSACGTNASVAALLIAKGADVKARTPDGTTALHTSALKGRADCIETLLKNGADVNAQDKVGNNAAHYVLSKFYNPYKEVLQVLIAHGIDVNARGEGGQTPLDYAKRIRNAEIVEFLKEHGAK